MRPQATAAGNARMRYGKQPCEEMQEAEDSNMLCLFRRGRVGPIPEVQVFCNSGWRITGQRQVLRIDCLPILNKPLPILPKNRRTIIPATSGSAIFVPLSEEAHFLLVILLLLTCQ